MRFDPAYRSDTTWKRRLSFPVDDAVFDIDHICRLASPRRPAAKAPPQDQASHKGDGNDDQRQPGSQNQQQEAERNSRKQRQSSGPAGQPDESDAWIRRIVRTHFPLSEPLPRLTFICGCRRTDTSLAMARGPLPSGPLRRQPSGRRSIAGGSSPVSGGAMGGSTATGPLKKAPPEGGMTADGGAGCDVVHWSGRRQSRQAVSAASVSGCIRVAGPHRPFSIPG
jgi:hypothetical protein